MKRLKPILSRRRVYGDLADEIQQHFEEKVEELVAGGMSRKEAAHAARREFGNMTLIEEDGREVWRWPSIEGFFMDLHYALRAVRRNPGFSLVVVLTLALGIGANIALFSVIDAVLLRPLPFQEPSRLVAVRCVDLRDPTHGGEISYPAFLDWRSQSRSFKGMSVWNMSSLTYTGGERAESLRSAVVSANLFSLLGVAPTMGRGFVEAEDEPGDEQLPVVLSYEFWQSHFGGNPNTLGQALNLDGDKYNVVGIMPPGFQFPVLSQRVDLWTTIARDRRGARSLASQRGVSYLSVIARLKPGIETPQAQADLRLVQEKLNQQYPENRPRSVRIRLVSEEIAGAMRPVLLLLLGAVGFVLLIACANVASLLLVRATVRQREFAVRAVLGASRWRIVRQLLAESVMLAMLAGATGLVFAQWAESALVSLAPEGLARTANVAFDFRTFGFAFVVAFVTGLLFGLAPAVQVARLQSNRVQTESGRTASGGPFSTRLRKALVTAQVAIAFVLLIGAGLLLRSFERLRRVDPGFRPDHVLTFLLEVPTQRHARAKRADFVRELLRSARELPGVKSASAIFGLPLNVDQSAFTTLEIEGHAVPASQRRRVAFRIIESNYFDTMKISLLHGRGFTERDEQGGPPLAIVNQTLARQVFNGENPVGRRIRPNISFGTNDTAPMREIVGVVGDVKSRSIGGEAVPEVYAPETPTDFIGEMTIVLRSQTDPEALVPAMRSLVSSMDKELPLRDVKTLGEYVSGSISGPRFEAVLLGTFAALAFGLTAIGLYGVVSYMVAQRTREIGIRIALGSQPGCIFHMVLREGALLTLIGVGAGLAGSLFAVRLIRGLLYGIDSTDPVTFFVVPNVLLAVALLASYLPARRAMRVDPMVALRYE
jgi:predicted permease